MLVDVPISDATVLLVGGGAIAERKVRKLLEEHATVIVASKEFTRGLLSLGARERVRLMKIDAATSTGPLRKAIAQSDIVIVATSDPSVNGAVARRARRRRLLVNAADNPSESDFNFPATAKVGDIRIAVSTGGRSPAMARLICAKLARAIVPEDRLGVELLGQVRDTAKSRLPSAAARRKALYRVLNDERVTELVGKGHLAEARRRAEEIIDSE